MKLQYKANEYESIGMVAGGTGITPMLQVVDEVLSNPDDKTKISLVFGNQTESDILLKDDIDARVAAFPDRLSVYYVVDKATSSSWTGGVGYVTKEMLASKIAPPANIGAQGFGIGAQGARAVSRRHASAGFARGVSAFRKLACKRADSAQALQGTA